MLEKNARYLRRRISARSADSGGFENVPVRVYAGGHGYECNRDRVPDAWSFLRIFISKQKRGVFFPKKRRAFVLGLDWVERINRWLYCSRPQAHSEAPPGDVFCTHIACFHIPTWGFEHK